MTKTQVAIVGGGPAGMLLAHALDAAGIRSVVLERRSRAYVLGRIRAGMLKPATVQILRDLGLAARMDKEGIPQRVVCYGWEGKETLRLDLQALVGKSMMAYGQSALTEDLYRAHDDAGRCIIHEVRDIELHDLHGSPSVTYLKDGAKSTLSCDFIAGCDGHYGACRPYIPADCCRTYARSYPFGWLGVLAPVPPLDDLVYARHSEGFVLASKRNPQLSRYYVQVGMDEKVEEWSDARFWDAVRRRLPPAHAEKVVTGESLEKSITPLHSFVTEPLQYGKLFLAGDAAHIVPPTGARGLNLAVSDVHCLSRALDAHYHRADDAPLTHYSREVLHHIWNAVDFSWRMSMWLHRFEGEEPFDQKLRDNQFDTLLRREVSRVAFAHEFCGTEMHQ